MDKDLHTVVDELFDKIERLQAENEKLKQVANDSIIEQEKLIAKVNELQAENERLSDSAYRQADYDYRLDDAEEKIEMLEQENERLKEENNELCKRMAEVTYRATGGRLSYPNYTLDAIEQAFYDQLEILSDQKSEEYKQTLQEIKTLLSQVDEYNWLHTGKHIYMDDRCISELKARIQAKINEVIGVEE